MKRIIWHWTAGSHRASAEDRRAYHYIIEGDGSVVQGDHPVLANEGPLVPGRYAAHVKNLNTGSVGVSLAAMAGARERPFSAGKHPITQTQVDTLVPLLAMLCREYDIPVSPQTVLSHAEVQATLGVPQDNKWDVTWLPGYDGVQSPRAIGDVIRAKVADHMAMGQRPQTRPSSPGPIEPAPDLASGWSSVAVVAVIFLALAAFIIFGG